jgi:hypothetical protein
MARYVMVLRRATSIKYKLHIKNRYIGNFMYTCLVADLEVGGQGWKEITKEEEEKKL